MSDESLFGLPAFLRLLSAHPTGDAVAQCLNDGIFAKFGASGTVIWLLEERELLYLVGYAGFTADEMRRWHRVPLSLKSHMVDVVRDNEIIIMPSAELPTQYSETQFDRVRFARVVSRIGIGEHVGLPVVHQGRCLGVAQFMTSAFREWRSLDYSVLNSVSAALGLWATHQETPITRLYVAAQDEAPLIVSERQRQIVALVLQGVGNNQIANELLLSVSTVKQDLQKLMRSTNQSDRLSAARHAVTMGLVPPPPK